MSKRIAIVLCCLAVIFAAATVAIKWRPAAAKEIGWCLKFKPGQTLLYSLQGSMTGMHSRTTTSTTMAESLRSVADDGTATLDVNLTQAFTVTGRDGVERPSGPTSGNASLLVSPKGSTTYPDNTGHQGGNIQPNDGAFLPDFYPKPGDTWQLPSPIQGIMTHATLTSIQADSKGHHIAQIDSTAAGTLGANPKPVSLKSTAMFDIDRGILVSRQTTMQVGSPVEMTTSDRQDLVKASE